MTSTPEPRRKRYVPAVGTRLKRLLAVVFGLFALLVVNSVYLAAVSATQWMTGQTWENYFFQWMFLVHLGLGLAIVLPIVVFGIFRYHHLAETTDMGDKPEEVLLRDRPIQMCGVAFGLLAVAALYWSR